MKKILCLLLAISLAVSVAVIAPVTASAAETEHTAISAREEKVPDASAFPVSVTVGCGTCVIDLDGTMTVSGTGDFDPNYDAKTYLPEWCASYVTKVIIEEGITRIGWGAFYNFKKLVSVTLPEGLTDIGESAFYSCPSLKSVTIPDSVENLNRQAFGYYMDDSYYEFTVDDFTLYGYTGNAAEYYASSNGLNFVSLGETQNPMYPMTGVNWECEWTLTEDGLLTISGSGEWYKAFNIDYERVREIIVEEGVTDIGNAAFNECSNLESVTINAKIPMIDVHTFQDCAKLKKVTLPDSIKSIEYNAFKGCNALDSITIPDSVDYIDIYALGYYWNENQDTVKVDGFTIYGYTGNAAEYYANKNGFNFVSLGETQNPMFPMKGTDGDCEWTLTEDGVLTISGSGELYRCDKLDSYYVREIIVEEGVEGICRGTFSSYENLESVTINAKIPMIGACAFDSCANLKNVTLPDSLKSIERVAFSCCTALESITIPDSVNYIGDCALGYGWDEDWNYSPIDGFTIYGYTGNAAEYYAKENGFNFVSLGESQNPATPDEATPDEATSDEATPDEATPDEATPDEATPDEPKCVGDANGDGVTDVLDATNIQKYLVGKIDYPEEYLYWLDVNNDGTVDVLDATDIQKYTVEKITEFNRKE